MRLLQKQLPGFTLIELIITVAISALVIGGSIAGFIGFTERQEVLNTAKEVQQMMRTAQSRARVRNTPTGCASLISYRVLLASNSMTLVAVCSNASYTITSKTFPTGVTISPTTTIRFTTLENGVTNDSGVTLPSSITYSVAKNGTTFQFTASPTGSISNVEQP